jgi:hypothetical protein
MSKATFKDHENLDSEVCFTEKFLTFRSANVETPPATRKVQRYSGIVYLIPYTSEPISITALK